MIEVDEVHRRDSWKPCDSCGVSSRFFVRTRRSPARGLEATLCLVCQIDLTRKCLAVLRRWDAAVKTPPVGPGGEEPGATAVSIGRVAGASSEGEQ